ncbi:hypothetical protein [Deinococcus cellulosilyticus]|uniref:Uncharacterized protein n=1 Tax=Deinococcus cellulosilyticus (strain DSM 18568 / NBRC 106333 / KACC 11606 / 5516J-15) TaxID=1223518 RepID=A0A511N096_DEIC1|nr:hypothetical protein [Deinococcus cellulosilyticus]GEM45931.1 hypothetical protein DC3_15660 [Deinococcus cellulosilyticus NBRC 106333 = KACC 11606]
MAQFVEAHDSKGTIILLNLDNVQHMQVQQTHDDYFYVEACMVQGAALKLASFDTLKEALAWARKLTGIVVQKAAEE